MLSKVDRNPAGSDTACNVTSSLPVFVMENSLKASVATGTEPKPRSPLTLMVLVTVGVFGVLGPVGEDLLQPTPTSRVTADSRNAWPSMRVTAGCLLKTGARSRVGRDSPPRAGWSTDSADASRETR